VGVYIEAKGKLDAKNRTRLVAFKAAYPEERVLLVFQRDNWLTKKHRQRYSHWAAANGYEYAMFDQGGDILNWAREHTI
jgi:hypothetical protein